MRLGTLVIAESSEEAAGRGAAMRAARRMPEEWYRRGVIEGVPETIAERAQELLDAGLDGLIFNMPDAQDLEPVAMAGEVLTKILGGGRHRPARSGSTQGR